MNDVFAFLVGAFAVAAITAAVVYLPELCASGNAAFRRRLEKKV